MKTPPAAVAPTTTPVTDIAARHPQTRLPRVNPQSPNRGRDEYRFPTSRNRPSQPGLRSNPTRLAASAKRALSIETANTDDNQ